MDKSICWSPSPPSGTHPTSTTAKALRLETPGIWGPSPARLEPLPHHYSSPTRRGHTCLDGEAVASAGRSGNSRVETTHYPPLSPGLHGRHRPT